MLTLVEDIIIQSEPEKQDKNQISEKLFLQRARFWIKNFYKVSDSEFVFLQRVGFWIKSCTTRQIFKQKNLKSTILKKKLN